jgi:hypothetical protein
MATTSPATVLRANSTRLANFIFGRTIACYRTQMRTPEPIHPDFGKKTLATATVQELQLELFRRSVASGSDIEEFIRLLLESQHLWRGLIIDRLGVNEGGHWLQPLSMIKLRNIRQNYWNADTLFVLCPNRDAAKHLAKQFPLDRFAVMIDIKDDPEEVDDALGGSDKGLVILQFWWD